MISLSQRLRSGLIVSLSLTGLADAAPLSNTQQYVRCYVQLTGLEPSPNSPLYLSVAANSITPIAACIQVLNSAALNSTGQLVNQNTESVAVLNKLNRLHNSWFKVRGYEEDYVPLFLTFKNNLFDPTGPALFYTKALFTPGERFGNIFSGNQNLIAKRDGGPITAPIANFIGINRTIFAADFDVANLVQKGNLIGIVDRQSFPANYSYFPGTSTTAVSGTVELSRIFGGGILGSPAYLQQVMVPKHYTTSFASNPPLDGGVNVLRRYGRSVMADFLCSDLPALNVSDVMATKYVDPNSTIPFRTSAACTSCHATMDQLAGVVRNVGFRLYGEAVTANNKVGISELVQVPTSYAAPSVEWSSTTDTLYAKRPTTGRLFYRTSAGTLVDSPLTGLASLGVALASQGDVYRCVAKRYYEYFLGVKIPARYTSGSLGADPHQATVVRLGEEFKQHQSLSSLIEAILASDAYRSR